ncbi:hypothetical protein D3C87_1803660 [compost metagenome]
MHPAYFYICTELKCEHFVGPVIGCIVHHIVPIYQVPVAGDQSASYDLYIVQPFSKKHGISEVMMANILFGHVIFRVCIRTWGCR